MDFRKSLLLFCATGLFACHSNNNLLEPCQKYKSIDATYISSSLTIVQQAGSMILHKIKYNGYYWNIGLSEDSTITYVSTYDSTLSFFGVHIYDTYADIPKELKADEISQQGFGYHVILNNGWTILCADSAYWNSGKIRPETPIVAFIKECREE